MPSEELLLALPLDESQLRKRFARVLKKAGLPHFRLYDLRHTFATHLLNLGVPITYGGVDRTRRCRTFAPSRFLLDGRATTIAATNRDLEQEVNRNAFREDLFYRLNVILIVMPHPTALCPSRFR